MSQSVGVVCVERVEVEDVELHPGLRGKGKEVKDGVRRAAHGHDHPDGVLERLPGHDVPWGDAAAHQLHERNAGGLHVLLLAGIHGGNGAAPGKAHPDGLHGGGHGVCGVHAAAGARARAGRALDAVPFLLGDLPRGKPADGLERADDIHRRSPCSPRP